MHSLWKHLETNISSITIICGMTYSKHLCKSLRCHLHFFHSSFYSSFSFSWGKRYMYINNPSSIATETLDRSWLKKLHGNLLFLYFRVSFISVLSPEKKMKIDHRFSFFIFTFLKKLKLNTDFLFAFSWCSEINQNRTSIFVFQFLKNKKLNTDFLFSMFAKKMKIENQLSIFFLFSTFRKKWMTLIYTQMVNVVNENVNRTVTQKATTLNLTIGHFRIP